MIAQPYTKKGAVQMTETIAVLLIFIIILGFCMILYFQYFYKSLESKGFEFKETDYSSLLYSLADSPEFSCSEGNCIDMTKLIALKQTGYSLKNKEIKIEIVYPEPIQKRECAIEDYFNQNYPNTCNLWIIPSISVKSTTQAETQANTIIVNTPISLYFPETDEFRIGIITLTAYLQ